MFLHCIVSMNSDAAKMTRKFFPECRALGVRGPVRPYSLNTANARTATVTVTFQTHDNELSQSLVRYCSVEDATLEGAFCCR